MFHIKKIAFFLILLTIISKILGFMRDIILAYYYGTSSISDVYIISLTIPGILFAFIGIAISTSFVPIYSSIWKKDTITDADNYLRNLISVLFIISTFLIILLLVFTEYIIKIFAVGFDQETLVLAVYFTRITAFGIYFSLVINIYIVYLNVRSSYIGPAFSGVPFNISIILSIIVSSQTTIFLLPLGLLFSLMVQFIYLKYLLNKVKFKYRFLIDLKNPNMKETLILSLPVLLGVSINQINILVDRTLASYLEVGGIAAINYASKINEFALGIFVISLLSFIYPRMVNFVQENEESKLVKETNSLLKSINTLIIPISFFGFFFSYEIVNVLYGRGAFGSEAIKMTSGLLKFYLLSLLAMSYREVLSRVFFSFQDTKTPTVNAAIGLIINVILNLLLSKIMGISGLALATSISITVSVILLSYSLRRKLKDYYIRDSFVHLMKISLITILPLIIIKILHFYFFNSKFEVLLLGLFYLLLVIIFFKLFKVSEMNVLFNILKKRF